MDLRPRDVYFDLLLLTPLALPSPASLDCIIPIDLQTLYLS